MRSSELQQRSVVVVALGAATRSRLSQPIRVEHHRVARPQSKSGGSELRLHRDSDGVATDGVRITRPTVGAKYERRKMPAAGKVDVEFAAVWSKDAENDCGELIHGVARLLTQDSMEVLQHRHWVGIED